MDTSLFEGQRILFTQKGPFNHQVGGELKGAGSQCPNCKRRLTIYLNLDLADRRVRFPDERLRRLPLVCCLDCDLFHFDFVYRIEPDGALRVLSALKSKDAGPNCRGSSYVRHKCIDVDLSPTPLELERMAAKLNARRQLTKEEEVLFARLTNNFARPDLGGYPIVDSYNQVGGRPFLIQRLEDPQCENCQKSRKPRMRFLASICNESQYGIELVPDDIQILYFACPKCAAILVLHSCS